MYPLKNVVFTTDATYVMEKEGCDLDEAQFLIEDQLGGLDYKEFPVVAKNGLLKRWDGVRALEDVKAKSVSAYISKLASCGADDIYVGEDADGVLTFSWTHHDGWGKAILISDEDGHILTKEDLWAY